MNKMILAAVLLSLTARVAPAGDFDFKSWSSGSYGTPWTYVPTTADDMTSAINGGLASQGGTRAGTLDELLQEGPTSYSLEYEAGPNGGYVAHSAAAVYHPAEPLSTAAPGIGAKVSAANNFNPGAATIIGENYVYLSETVSVNNASALDFLIKSYAVTLSLDGVIHTSGDAVAQVGQAIRITLEDGLAYTTSDLQTFKQGFGGLVTTYNFGQPFQFGDPLTLTNTGPYGTELVSRDSRSMTVETLLYLRAQTGGLERGAGMASADFSNTLQVTNIQFFDQNDKVIPGLRVVGSTGAVYPYNAIPEPAALVLFGAGAIGLLLARRKKAFRS